MRPTRRILIDLDCVLADFVGGVALLWGHSKADLLKHWLPGEYPCQSALARASLRSDPISDTEFWNRIEDAPGFWAALPVLPWARDLLSHVRSVTADWWIVTAPSRCPRCIPEKREWLYREFGLDAAERMIPTQHKYLLAQQRVALIDDHDENLDAFAAAGGFVVPVPSRHNRHHTHDEDPMSVTLPTLESFLRITAK